MSDIPSHLLPKLRETLLSCTPVYSNNELRDVFKDQRISPWRFSIPSRDTPQARVDALIAFLAGKQRADTKENALVLFLQAARDLLNDQDEDYITLNQTAHQLAQALGSPIPSSVQATPSPVAAPVQYEDLFSPYERGLKQLGVKLGSQHPRYVEFSTNQIRLLENIRAARRLGDSEEREVKRAELIDRLNHLALTTIGQSFTDLCL